MVNIIFMVMAITDTSDKKPGSPITDHLQDASELAGRGEYASALQRVRSVKPAQPENVYVLAFERQLEQLVELTESGMITEEQRTDILESIPGIVERAIEQPDTRPADMNSPERRTATKASMEERLAALSWLKNQYFQHAHDYVQKGQFSHALTEIQRVFIIDPNDDTARDFEKQIHKLLELKQQATGAVAGSSPAEGERARKESTFWIIAAGVVFIVVAILVIYFLNR